MKFIIITLALIAMNASAESQPAADSKFRQSRLSTRKALVGAEKLPIASFRPGEGDKWDNVDVLLTNYTDEEVEYQLSTYFDEKPETYRLAPNASHNIRYVANQAWGNPFLSYHQQSQPNRMAVEKVLGNRRAYEFRTDANGVAAREAGPLVYEIEMSNDTNTAVTIFHQDCSTGNWRSLSLEGGQTEKIQFWPTMNCDAPKVSFYVNSASYFYRIYAVKHFAAYRLELDADRKNRLVNGESD